MTEVMQQFTPDEAEPTEKPTYNLRLWEELEAKDEQRTPDKPEKSETFEDVLRDLGWASIVSKGSYSRRIAIIRAVYQRGIEAGRREPNE